MSGNLATGAIAVLAMLLAVTVLPKVLIASMDAVTAIAAASPVVALAIIITLVFGVAVWILASMKR